MATSNACKPTCFVPDREDIGEKKLFVLAALRQHSLACDLLVQWPESPESADNRFGALPAWRTRDTSSIRPASCQGAVKEVELWEINCHRQRGDPSSPMSAVPSCPPESPRITLPHFHPVPRPSLLERRPLVTQPRQ